MLPKDLPDRWKSRAVEWIRARRANGPPHLGAGDFPSGELVRLQFPDGSCAAFRCAIAIEATELGEIGVFTEHCGYHVFPLIDTQVSRPTDSGSEPLG